MDLYEGNKTFNWELVGEGNTYGVMIVDLIDCDQELMETKLLSLFVKGVWKQLLIKNCIVIPY